MKIMISRIFALTLALCMAFTLLTACSNGGDTPTGDVSTPVVTHTQTPDNEGATDTSPDDTTEPSNTPRETEATTPGANETQTKIEEPKYDMPSYDEAAKAEFDEYIATYNSSIGIDIENIIDEIYEKYGKYLNVNITKDAIGVGTITGTSSSYYKSFGGNLTGISPDAMKKVNDFLTDNGEDKLDSEIPEQNIAALWLAASLYYDPDYVHENETYRDQPCNDIAMAFGLARADSSTGDAERNRSSFWSVYVSLFGGPFVIAEALK